MRLRTSVGDSGKSFSFDDSLMNAPISDESEERIRISPPLLLFSILPDNRPSSKAFFTKS
jgi:hypothetical protein